MIGPWASALLAPRGSGAVCGKADPSSRLGGSSLCLGDRACDDRSVFADSSEDRGLALAEEVHADEVQTVRYAAGTIFVNREAELIERVRDANPGFIVRSKPSCKNDRCEALQVERLAHVRFE